MNLFYCVHVIRLTISTYIMYKCCPNKTVFFIVFTVTLLPQGQFKVETTTSCQPYFNVETTTLFQPSFKLISTLKSQRQYSFQIQPYFNHVSTLTWDRCFNVDTALLCLPGKFRPCRQSGYVMFISTYFNALNQCVFNWSFYGYYHGHQHSSLNMI